MRRLAPPTRLRFAPPRLRLGAAVLGLLTLAAPRSPAEDVVYPGQAWQPATPSQARMDRAALEQARDYALSGGGSGYITRGGRLVMAWGDPRQRYDLKSTTKSIGVTALGLAIADGKMALDDAARKHHRDLGTPLEENARTGWLDEITILHLATQTAGFEKPGGYGKLLFRPGSNWHYSDAGPNWLAECVTLAYGRDVHDLMSERVFAPLGITPDDLTWRNNAYRPQMLRGVARREFGSGVHANVDAMARIGLLYLQRGRWGGRQIIPRGFVEAAAGTVPPVVGLPEHDPENYGNASDHYGLLWWNNADGTLKNVPRDAFWSWGLYDSLILVIPSHDVVVSRAGKSWPRGEGAGHYDVLRPFFEPIVGSVGNDHAERSGETARPTRAPYPPSPVITACRWAPTSSIVRKARGSDNWPITWADDDRLYTAYGDGWGFQPKVTAKLSLGLARIDGGPEDFTGVNLRCATAEQVGQGAAGKKASGMLMVDGRLYMAVRNAGNAQLAWSDDRGQTWHWCDWRFTDSFGCPTFLNFGRDYAGARDSYVYVYSHDHQSAYEPADRMVLTRVPKDRVALRGAYEFFRQLDAAGQPVWSNDVTRRGAVFSHPGRCYRSAVSYNAALKRYLWCQILPGDDTRFEGGFGVYDAPEPWGPWTTVYFTGRWDVGPGETAGFPPKWISADGKTLHLVFSGDDCFSVRQVTLTVAPVGT
ncbi:MAG: serine hydrolase [Pirellulales bacterium]|nr:serine hydrolase [Pirellulales bacterium]